MQPTCKRSKPSSIGKALMSELTVTKLNRSGAGFYTVMGPFFGSRQVAEEVGIHLYDDANKTWFVCVDVPAKLLLGCASVRGRLVSDCYVIPGRRNSGIFSALLDALLADTQGPLRANCTHASLKAFKSRGFKPVRKSKNFTYVELHRA